MAELACLVLALALEPHPQPCSVLSHAQLNTLAYEVAADPLLCRPSRAIPRRDGFPLMRSR